MDTEYFNSLFAYNYWANARILNAASELDDERFAAVLPGTNYGLRSTINHILSVESLWYQRCHGVSPGALPTADRYATVRELRAAWQELEPQWRDYVASLSAEDLSAAIAYRNTRGVDYKQPLWQLLAHVVNHGTQHRSEAAMMLTAYGHSPGDVDLVMYLRDRLPPAR
jgi:uncharacterized damage-inducible protein DinB